MFIACDLFVFPSLSFLALFFVNIIWCCFKLNSHLVKQHFARKGARQRALQLLEQVGLAEHVKKYPAQLSGGQMQRVAIARTLALSPAIILFDEPMSALDVATRLSLRAELKRIQQESGATMLYITHDQEEAFALSDRIMVMSAGQIHQLGTPQQLLDEPADDYVRRFVLDNLQTKINSLLKYAVK